jgi:type IV pilus assembly protein PilY1
MFIVIVIGLAPVSHEAFAQESVSQECVSVTSRKSVSIDYGIGNALLIERSDDGVLRGLDAATRSELWQFVPPETATSTSHSGLMTDLAVLRFDANGDGVIDKSDGDRVWVYFGLKRAGPFYYAIDVTDRTPRMLWRQDAATLSGLGEAWSTPALTRARIAGATQNGERFVVILGGGLDGARLFMLDAATGRLLWSAGSDSSADRVLPRMTEGIAARVTAIDFDGDEYADRLYAADVGGRIWRFDIWNGRDKTDLVTGGIFAQLSATTPGDARRFFNAPDVSLIRSREGRLFLNIAIGSGDATDPNAVAVQDRFYSLRDYQPFVKRSQATYDAATPLVDADLTGASAGWKLDLRTSGEKALTDSLTVDGAVMFTTYEPSANAAASNCEQNGKNRVYYVWIDDAAAVMDLNDDAKVTDEDRSAPLTQRGIAEGPRIERLPGRAAGDPSTSPSPSEPGTEEQSTGTRCLAGAEVLKRCLPLGTVLRTYWKRNSVN